jgi:hypothetical protein
MLQISAKCSASTASTNQTSTRREGFSCCGNTMVLGVINGLELGRRVMPVQ